ncbi:MAG: type III secretion system stator protein SctL [Kiritimatiellae bacterium]|nr:type III secretion system stator protein SctL [Kiritimatiellia bacterium]
MLLLKKKTFEVESASPVVKAEDAAALVSSDAIIAAAEAEAKTIVAAAQTEYENEKRRGYADGLAAGKAEILMKKLDLVEEAVAYMQKVEGEISDLVIKALQKCLSQIGNTEVVCQIVKKSMRAIVHNQRQVTVKVAPTMVESVKQWAQAQLAEFPSLTFIDVVEDTRLTETACVVETEAGSVEASAEGQLKALAESFRHHFSKES